MTLFINPKLVDTRNAYQREARSNLKELKTIMEKLVVKDNPKSDSVFKPASKPGGSVWTYREKKRTFAL